MYPGIAISVSHFPPANTTFSCMVISLQFLSPDPCQSRKIFLFISGEDLEKPLQGSGIGTYMGNPLLPVYSCCCLVLVSELRNLKPITCFLLSLTPNFGPWGFDGTVE